MRSPVTALVLAAACGSSTHPPPPAPSPAPTPASDDHALHDRSEIAATAQRLRYEGRGVALTDMPAAAVAVGLPLAGTADVAIDITIPVAGGARDYRRARGSIEVRCAQCIIGDDVAKLAPRTRSKRTDAFVGDGFFFGHIAFDRVEARIEIKDGRAELVRWVADSPDMTLDLALAVDLADTYGRSALRGCLRFKGKPALRARDPRTDALLSATGAPLGSDDLFHIELAGSPDEPKLLGHLCGSAATPADPSAP